MPRLDLVLVNPGSRKLVYQDLARELAAIEPPIWAAMCATYARNMGVSVAIVDAEAEGLSAEAVAERVAELDPRLVAVVVYGHQPSASTQNMTACSAAVTALKEHAPDRPVLMLGGHVAALPDRTLQEERADFVSDGEGPVTVVDLVAALRAGESDLSKVRGLRYREHGLTRRGAPAPLITDLDATMAGPAWDLLPMERYRAHNWHCFGHLDRMPYGALYTTLGCPYHCSFCCIQAPFRSGEALAGYKPNVNSYRFWKPETIVDQLETLVVRYGVKNVKLADELFVLNARHVSGICDLIVERRLPLNIWAYGRVDTMKPALMETMARAGVTWIALGIEAASERVRDDVDKGFRPDDVFRACERIRAAGMSIIGNYIFGLPEDDLASMQATLDLALELNCEFANFYCAMAYPGSALYQTALTAGWALPERWTGYSQHAADTLPLPTRHLSAAEVLRFRDGAFHTYFTSPPYLEMVTRRFGDDTATHIRQMTTHRLQRRFA